MLIPAARNGQDTPPAPFTPHMFRLLAMAAQILERHLPAALRNDRGSFAALFAAFDPRSRKRPEKRPANAVITGGGCNPSPTPRRSSSTRSSSRGTPRPPDPATTSSPCSAASDHRRARRYAPVGVRRAVRNSSASSLVVVASSAALSSRQRPVNRGKRMASPASSWIWPQAAV